MTTTPQAALLSDALEKMGDFFHAHEAWQLCRIDDGRIQLHLTDDQYEAVRLAVADKLKPRSSTLTNDELIDLAVEHGLGRTLPPLGLNTGNVFYTDNSYRTAALFDFADAHEAAILAKLQATQEPVQTTDPWDHDFIAGRLPRRPMAPVEPAQAGELPEPDAVFYCSEDTGYLTQYRNPPSNLTDGDVAMYEADTVRSLISAAPAARKPLTDEQRGKAYREVRDRLKLQMDYQSFSLGCDCTERAHGIGLEVKP